MISNIIKNEKGLTLIEITIAMLIILLIAMTYSTATTTSFSGYYFAGKKTIALNYAREILENLKTSFIKPLPVTTEKVLPAAGYSYKFGYTLYNTAVSTKVYQVDVSVYYLNNGIKQSCDLSTLVYWVR